MYTDIHRLGLGNTTEILPMFDCSRTNPRFFCQSSDFRSVLAPWKPHFVPGIIEWNMVLCIPHRSNEFLLFPNPEFFYTEAK